MTNKKTFEEWLNEAEWPTAEESAQYKAEREAAKGTMTESAMMMENGEISGKTWCYGYDGVVGDDWFTVLPTDEDYETAKKYYSLSKPGDRYSVIKKWQDNHWVVVEEKRPNLPNQADAGKAKSA